MLRQLHIFAPAEPPGNAPPYKEQAAGRWEGVSAVWTPWSCFFWGGAGVKCLTFTSVMAFMAACMCYSHRSPPCFQRGCKTLTCDLPGKTSCNLNMAL